MTPQPQPLTKLYIVYEQPRAPDGIEDKHCWISALGSLQWTVNSIDALATVIPYSLYK